MIRKHNKFERPRTLYDKTRIHEENKLKKRYGLKNKREIWKAETKIKYYRSRAKDLITESQEEQQLYFTKLNKIGLNVHSIADVLALTKENLLKRRLPTIMVEKKLASTPKHARQLVVHKRALINGRAINIPSYLVSIEEEKQITIKPQIKKAPQIINTEETNE